MRFLLVFAFFLSCLPSFAQNAAPNAPVLIENIWHSDAGLEDAENLIKQKKYTEAILVLEKIVQRNMRNADAHVDMAIAYADQGNLERAKTSLTNAFAIDKGHMGAYVVGGVIALKEGDKTQADYYLGAIRTVCQGELCPEYQTLKKAILDAK